MGLNVGSLNNINSALIDSNALARVSEKILTPKEQTVDVSKLNLSKFNRVSLGTDLYAERTNTNTALQASKAATDFGVNLSQSFNANVQYLNSQAAQSLFTSKENTGKIAIAVEQAQQVDEQQVVLETSQVLETKNMNKDKRGSNPFSFYMPANQKEENEDNESNLNSINIFA